MTHDPSKTSETNQPQADAATEEEATSVQTNSVESVSVESDVTDVELSEEKVFEPATESTTAQSDQVDPQVTANTGVNEAVALPEEAEASPAKLAVEEQTTAEEPVTVEDPIITAEEQTSPLPPEQAEVAEPDLDRPPIAPTPTASPSSESPSAAQQPVSGSPSPAASNQFQSFLQAMRRLGGVLWTIWLAVSPVLLGIARGIWQLTLSLLKGIQQGWKAALPRIKRLLPEGWNKLPDWFLTTIAIALLVFVSWVSILLLPGRSSSVEPTETQPPSAVSPQPAPAAPDPDLIADIQTQVAEVTDQYAEGLIQSVQANFRLSQLTVQVGDGWYGLTPEQQDQLASELLRRSRKLEFNDLEMTNSAGDLLARNPVVGSRMVIYERS